MAGRGFSLLTTHYFVWGVKVTVGPGIDLPRPSGDLSAHFRALHLGHRSEHGTNCRSLGGIGEQAKSAHTKHASTACT